MTPHWMITRNLQPIAGRVLLGSAVVGLALLLLPSLAEAAGHCGFWSMDRKLCEASHHGGLFAVMAALVAMMSVMLSLLWTAGTNSGGAGGPGRGPDVPPKPVGPPPLIDPWEGQVLITQDGSYEGGKIGQVWYHGKWMDRDEAAEVIAEDKAVIAKRAKEQEEFWSESQEKSAQWMKDRVTQGEAEAAAERQQNRRWDNAWSTLEKVRASAEQRGYDDILARLDKAHNPDGTLNVEYVEELGRATRNRIGRDIAAPDDELQRGWVGEAVGQTLDDAVHNPLIRIGAGVLSGGSSEVFFQSLAAGEAMKAALDKAMDQNKDYTFTDAIRTGMGQLAEENLPLNTFKALQDPNASWGNIAGNLALDAFTGFDVANTARNLRGSLAGATHGQGLSDILTHQADPLDLMKPFRGDGEGKLWREPNDIDWQLKGPSVKHMDEGPLLRSDLQTQIDKLPPDIRAEVQKARSEPWRDPVGSMEDYAFRQGRVQGAAAVDEMDSAWKQLDEAKARGDVDAIAAANDRVRQATMDVQADKHAMHRLNDRAAAGGGSDPLVANFNRKMNEVYDATDDNLIQRLAREKGVSPDDIQVVKVTNVGPEGLPSGPRADKASYDRDITVRVRQGDEWVDIPANDTAREYNKAFWEASTGKPLPAKLDVEGRPMLDAGGKPVLDEDALRAHSEKMDQVATDRQHAEAYGAGQADLQAATQDVHRHKDFSDAHQVSEAMGYKVDHWINKADQARNSGNWTQAAANLEEGQRQLVKQFDNMVVKRTDAMTAVGNAPGATVPAQLQAQVDVLRLVNTGGLSPSQAETVLQSMGTNTRQVADAMGSYTAGLQVLRRPGG